MEKSVTVILSAYKRSHCLTEQYNSIQNQTIKPKEILLWQNNSEFSHRFDTSSLHNVKHTSSNNNFGVWARFAHALNSKSKYVCIFDDDTMPGTKWLENCINSFEQKNGLYGTIGLIYKSPETYMGAQRVGWDGINNENTMQVDIVGHSWFFEREMLSTFWRELPEFNDFYVGEDMHFSHMLQKYTDLKTYVPPHPTHDKEMWGSLKGFEYGGDNVATGNFAVPMMDEYFKKIVNKGFKVINS
jgi:hypothetical protein